MPARPVPASLVLALAAVAACGARSSLDAAGTTGAGSTGGRLRSALTAF